MTLDPIEHYGVSPEIAEAMMEVLENIAAREGSALPSDHVIGNALTALGWTNNPPSRHTAPAIVYRVPSMSQARRLHFVTLYMLESKANFLGPVDSPTIIDAECSCEATGPCWHLLVALTCAERDGYHLETGR